MSKKNKDEITQESLKQEIDWMRQRVNKQQENSYNKQMRMDNDIWKQAYQREYNAAALQAAQGEAAKRQAEQQQRHARMQAIQNAAPVTPEWHRTLAQQVRCLKCDGKDPKDCWDCSGTGITPVPFSEVMMNERKDKNEVNDTLSSKDMWTGRPGMIWEHNV